MSGNVIELADRATVDSAWESYAELARRIRDDQTLLFDRAFNEELARRHDRWRRLFLIGDRV